MSNSGFVFGKILLGTGPAAMTIYDLSAPFYGAWSAVTETKAHQRALAILRESPCERLLEVAVGTGTESAVLSADSGRKLSVATDLSMNMLKQVRKRIRRTPNAHAVLCRADARVLPFRSGMFDCLVSCYMLDLLPEGDIPTVSREFKRVLSHRGRLIIVVMGLQPPIMQQIWMAAFRHIPVLVGGCRPIEAVSMLRATGWTIERREQVSQSGFRSEVLLARP
jgi:ubiquinone/menaquinone biosynthesis C-methylase UbiE